MIVKNEENNIEKCILSAINIVKEIIVIDTGSEDDTKNIASKISSKVKVYDFSWNNNFSDARNYSISKASQKWILWLDADEIIELNNSEQLKGILEKEAKAVQLNVKNFLGYSLKSYEVANNKSIRLFKRCKEIFFTGSIHETVNYSTEINDIDVIFSEYMEILHYGYLDNKEERYLRNVKLIKQELALNKNNPRSNFNLAIEYFNKNDYKNALYYFVKTEKIISNKTSNFSFYPRLIRNIVYCNIELGEFNKALKKCEKALINLSFYTDLWYLKGLIHFRMNDMLNAEVNLKKALELGDEKIFDGNAGLGSYKALSLLSEVYQKNSKEIKLIESCNQGIENFPFIISFFTILTNLYIKNENYELAFEIIELGSNYHPELIPLKNKLYSLKIKFEL